MERQESNPVLSVVSEELEATRNEEQNNGRSQASVLKRPCSGRSARPTSSTKRKRRGSSSSVESSEENDEKTESSDEEWSEHLELDESSEDSDPAWAPDSSPNQKRTVERGTAIRRGRKPKNLVGGNHAGVVPPRPSQPVPQIRPQQAAAHNGPAEEENPLAEHYWYFRGYTNGIDPKSYTNTTFIMLKSDAKTQAKPTLWRVDGKSLLQKYDPTIWDGVPAYRSVSTYTSWNPAKRGLFVPVEVSYLLHGRSDTVVSFSMDSLLLPLESSIAKKITEEGNTLADLMDIYVQTLLSQALDKNFLSEIYNEKDEYFLTSINNIEMGVVRPRLTAVAAEVALLAEHQNVLETFPGYRVKPTIAPDKVCRMCGAKNLTRRIAFSGQPYNRENLLPRMTNMEAPSWVLCYPCLDKALLYHQLYHFRYRLFTECSRKIEQHGSRDNGPLVLKDCIADQLWMTKVRRTALLFIAEAEQFVQHGNT